MNLSAELTAIAETADRFARRDLAPRALDLDHYPFSPFNQPSIDAGHAAGLFGVNLPEDLGGAGLGMAALCETLFSLARHDASFAAVVLADSLARSLLLALGRNDDARLSNQLIGFPIYDLPHEPQAGVIARREPDAFVLSGTVESVALAPVAAALILPALLDGRPALFLAAPDAAGLKLAEPLVSLGLRGCPAADVGLIGARLPGDGLLTKDAVGTLTAVCAPYRAAATAIAAGISEGSFQAARAYAAERYQGGRMIIEYDMVRQMLAGLAVASRTGQAIFRQLARMAEPGPPSNSEPAKIAAVPGFSESGFLLAADQAAQAATDGVQCLGGYGYMEDYGQEKRMRDAKQCQGIFGPAPLRRLKLLDDILA